MNVTLGQTRLYNNLMNQQRQALIDKNYNEIYAHELAHQRAGGSFAGNIVIERNSEGIPVGGHVPIAMPVLDEANPQKTINHANVVIRSALAPANPSGQDYKVATQARNIKQQAISFKNNNPNLGKKLDVEA